MCARFASQLSPELLRRKGAALGDMMPRLTEERQNEA